MENKRPEVAKGEVYVPAGYRALYDLSVGDFLQIGSCKLKIAGFIRDSQMNSMMASSKRFLVNEADYERIKEQGEEENGGNTRIGKDATQLAGVDAPYFLHFKPLTI